MLDFQDLQEYYKYATGDKVPTNLGYGQGIYKCFCNEFALSFTDLIQDQVHITHENDDPQ